MPANMESIVPKTKKKTTPASTEKTASNLEPLVLLEDEPVESYMQDELGL